MTPVPRIKHSQDSLALGFVLLVVLSFVIASASTTNDSQSELVNQRLFFGAIVGIICGVSEL